jgi:SAM-dependent methyltransferase
MNDYNPELYKKPCTVCTGPTSIWGVVDYNKSCEEQHGKYLEYAGVAIYYLKCHHCGHLFTPDFDDWSTQDFLDNIYNEDYHMVDPEYDGTRSTRDAEWFAQSMANNKHLDIMDYGAGTGIFGKQLKDKGFKVESWDPLWNKPVPWDSQRRFDFITAFEVLEHSPSPRETVKQMVQWLKPSGQILITTLSNDILQGKRDPSYWYLAPRNGHVAMFSNKSIQELFATVGMKVQHLALNTHLATY